MPLEHDDQQRVEQTMREVGSDDPTRIVIRNASESQKLGPVTVICMILNRTVGK